MSELLDQRLHKIAAMSEIERFNFKVPAGLSFHVQGQLPQSVWFSLETNTKTPPSFLSERIWRASIQEGILCGGQLNNDYEFMRPVIVDFFTRLHDHALELDREKQREAEAAAHREKDARKATHSEGERRMTRKAISYRGNTRGINHKLHAKRAKAERIARGMTRRELDREREAKRQAALAKALG